MNPLTWLRELQKIPEQADYIASTAFPGQARDETQMNAFRHALGSGMTAQHLGADKGGVRAQIAGLLAKAMGHGWEALDGYGYLGGSPRDTRHDLNNNAVGIEQAQQLGNSGLPAEAQRAELIRLLMEGAAGAPVREPPGMFSPHVSTLTRSR